jgi:hypothetical protein
MLTTFARVRYFDTIVPRVQVKTVQHRLDEELLKFPPSLLGREVIILAGVK